MAPAGDYLPSMRRYRQPDEEYEANMRRYRQPAEEEYDANYMSSPPQSPYLHNNNSSSTNFESHRLQPMMPLLRPSPQAHLASSQNNRYSWGSSSYTLTGGQSPGMQHQACRPQASPGPRRRLRWERRSCKIDLLPSRLITQMTPMRKVIRISGRLRNTKAPTIRMTRTIRTGTRGSSKGLDHINHKTMAPTPRWALLNPLSTPGLPV